MTEKMMKEDAGKHGFTIREMQKNQSDAQLLAESFNTWDDPESWPGGFGHGDPFTAERILEGLEKSTPLSKFVALIGNKIVGHCDVIEHFTEEDMTYIGLLGVNPEHQGKKIGKSLLLYANSRTLELEKDIIGLHTWGGNLKAVPLYKKTGYFWAPDSSVYMESFMPGILRRKLFKNYFDKFDWYSTYQRALTLEPDVEKINAMDVYTHYFEADENNNLKVLVDVRAKKICGFELTNPEGKIGAICLVESSIGYIGFDSVPVTWTLINETTERKQFTLKLKAKNGLRLLPEPDFIHDLEPGEVRKIEGQLALNEDVNAVNDPNDCHERTKQLLETTILIDEEEIDLTVGIVPVDPLEIDIYPELRAVFPGEQVEIPLQFWNRTQNKMKTSIILSDIEGIEFLDRNITLNLDPEQKVHQVVKINISSDYSRETLPIDFNIYKEEKNKKTKLPNETLTLAVLKNDSIRKQNLSAYTKGKKYAILENRYLRLKIPFGSEFVLNSITDKRDNKEYDYQFIGYLDVGLPFVGWANEFKRIIPEYKIVRREEQISIIFTYRSEVKAGLKVERIFTLFAEKDHFKVTGRITNESQKVHKNIGLIIDCDSWGGFAYDGCAYFPLTRGILCIDDFQNFRSSRYLARDPKDWVETWFCTEFEDKKLLGTIWDKTYMKKLDPRVSILPTFEYYFGDFAAGDTKEASQYFYLTAGSWKDFREIWKKQVNQDSSVLLGTGQDEQKVIDALTIQVDSETYGTIDSFGILTINSKDTINLKLVNNTFRNLNGKLMITLPKGINFEDNENQLEETISDLIWDKDFEKQIKLSANEIYHGRIIPIKVHFQIEGEKFDLSFLCQIVNKDTKLFISTETDETGKEILKVENGLLTYTASKDHCGAITSLQMPSISDLNNITSSWPKIKPFGHNSHWIGGIYFSIFKANGWGFKTHNETFTSQVLDKGSEKGIRFITELTSEAQHRGIKLESDYTTLPNSNILKGTFRAINNTNSYVKIRTGFDAKVAVSEKVTNDIYFLRRKKLKKRTYFSRFYEYLNKDKWAVFIDNETKMGLAVIGPDLESIPLEIADNGKMLNSAYTLHTLTIPPKETIEYSVLFILYPLNHNLLDNLLEFY